MPAILTADVDHDAGDHEVLSVASVMFNMFHPYMTTAQSSDPSGHVEVTVTDARGRLPELIDTQVREGGVVYLTRYGRRVGAVVPAEVAEQFEQWEDAYWSRRAAEVLDRNEPTVPWEQAVVELETGDAATGTRSAR